MNKKLYFLAISLNIILLTGCLKEETEENKVERKLLQGEASENFHQEAEKFFAEGDYRRALQSELQQLEEDLKYYKRESAEIAVDYNNIALNYDKLKEYNNSIIYYQKAIKIDNKVLELDNHEKSTTYYNIASSYESIKAYDKALNYYLKSLQIKAKPKEKLITYQDIAKIYQLKGDQDKALLYYKNAFIVYKRVEPKDKAIGVNILENMEALKASKK